MREARLDAVGPPRPNTGGWGGLVARGCLLALAHVVLAGCADDRACVDTEVGALIDGTPATAVERGALALIRTTADLCTAVRLTPQWLLTAAHCLSGEIPGSARVHPALDLALVRLSAEPGAVTAQLFMGDFPREGVALAFRTRSAGGPADAPIGASPIDGEIDQAIVPLSHPTPAIASAEVAAGGPSLCSGDSGSALFARDGDELLLLGIFSQSSGANGASICTPAGGVEYWVIAAVGREWLESVVGPCGPGASGDRSRCTFVDSPSIVPRGAAARPCG